MKYKLCLALVLSTVMSSEVFALESLETLLAKSIKLDLDENAKSPQCGLRNLYLLDSVREDMTTNVVASQAFDDSCVTDFGSQVYKYAAPSSYSVVIGGETHRLYYPVIVENDFSRITRFTKDGFGYTEKVIVDGHDEVIIDRNVRKSISKGKFAPMIAYRVNSNPQGDSLHAMYVQPESLLLLISK